MVNNISTYKCPFGFRFVRLCFTVTLLNSQVVVHECFYYIHSDMEFWLL